MDEADILLEPAKAYSDVYKQRLIDNANKKFDGLLAKSAIDVAANRQASAEYRKKKHELDKFKKSCGRLKALRVLMIVLAVLGVIVALIGASAANAAVIAVSAVVAGACVAVWLAVLNPRIKRANQIISKLEAEAEKSYNKAMSIILPLLSLFDSNMTFELLRETVPTLEIDDNFNMKRYDYFSGKYGLSEQYGDETSVVGVVSGQINGNPYIFEKILRHRMGTQIYTGSKTIHWVTYSRDSNGRRVAHHHSQVLTASVTKPKPFYSTGTRLIYGNDAAPDLQFSRKPEHSERLTGKQMQSKVKSKSKKIRKKAAKEMASGFTGIGNEEFDVLFNALDRNNEVQFRLLFTPLAQKNLLELIKGKSPYGDDFGFFKDKCLNFIESEHSQGWDIDTDSYKYKSYDVDICRSNFINVNSEYFKSFFFDMAPLLAIPLYQQIKPREYIYGERYERNYTAREAEILANKLGYGKFAHPAGATQAILKTEFREKCGDCDRVNVTAYSYRTHERLDFATRMGGDGRLHTIPIPWIQYIAVRKETGMSINSLNMDENEFNHSRYAKPDGSAVFYHKLYATLGEDGELYEDPDDYVESENPGGETIDLSEINDEDDSEE